MKVAFADHYTKHEMPRPKDPDSLASTAVRLTAAMGFHVSVGMVRGWKRKGYPLDDPEKLRARVKNQERQPAALAVAERSKAKPEPPPQLDEEDIQGQLADLKSRLLAATDYEAARTLQVQITGLKSILAELRLQAHYMPLAEALEGAALAGAAVNAAWEGIEDELPPILEGLPAMAMKGKLRDYARSKCIELSQCFEITPD